MKTLQTVTMILSSICFIYVLYIGIKYPKEETREIKSGIFHHRYGGAICGEFIETACGITLKKCVDEVEYYCLHDVSANFDKKQ